MTQTQEEALAEAKRVILLHFDSFVLTTRARTEEGRDFVSSDWHGSLSDVIGMNHMTGVRLDHIVLHDKLP